MIDFSRLWNRIGVISTIIDELPAQSIGRTAVVKLLYILQAVRGVPLNYDFRLYTYGPFDSEVLSDLDYAVSLGALSSEVSYFSNGYNYRIQLAQEAKSFIEEASDFLSEYQNDIDWVVSKFGSKSATDLELIGTIIYVDRAFYYRQESVDVDRISQQVREIKPRFIYELIKEMVFSVLEMGILKSIKN